MDTKEQEFVAFFSYSRQDSGFALKLATDLRQHGANVWLDQLDIDPGDRWDSTIEKALAECAKMLVILSPDSVESTNVMDEVSFALEEHKVVIPILFKDCKIPFRLRRVQYVDVRTDYERGLQGLLRMLHATAAPHGTAEGAGSAGAGLADPGERESAETARARSEAQREAAERRSAAEHLAEEHRKAEQVRMAAAAEAERLARIRASEAAAQRGAAEHRPPTTSAPPVYVSALRRAGADMIDWLFWIFILAGIGQATSSPVAAEEDMVIVILGLSFCIFKTGKTGGHKLTGTRIVASNGKPLTYLRSLGYVCAWLICSPLAVWGTALIVRNSKRHAALYDMLAGTAAVNERR